MAMEGTQQQQEKEEEVECAIGNLLSGSWELAQRILDNLNYSEVSELRLVCKTWADVGEMILAKRRSLHYLTIHPHCIPTTHGKVAIGESSPANVFKGFFSHIVSKPRYCLAFCNANWINRTDVFTNNTDHNSPITLLDYLHRTLPLSCDFCIVSATGIIGTVESAYQGQDLQCAKTFNQEILNFIEGTEEGNQEKPAKKKRKLEEEDEIEEEGVEVKGWESNVGYSVEVEQDTPAMSDADAVTLLIIPHHPGVRVNFFEISPHKFYTDFRGGRGTSTRLPITEEELNTILSVPSNEPLACLLLFDTCEDDAFTVEFVRAALARDRSRLALGGGVADALQSIRAGNSVCSKGESCKGEGSRVVCGRGVDSLFGVAVSGPNITAASVVIPKSVSNPTQLGRYIRKLKKCGLPERQSVAFMFTCCSRGYSFWRPVLNFTHENVESRAFRRLFPNTPLFGFFGRGEIGITHLPPYLGKKHAGGGGPSSPPAPSRTSRTTHLRAHHEYSTVIVLLSFL